MKYIILLLLTALFSCQEKPKSNTIVKTKIVTHKKTKQRIYVFGLGDVSVNTIDFVKKELSNFYNYDVIVLPNKTIPKTLKVSGVNKYQ